MSWRRGAGQGGFTLLEMLVALMLLGLVTAAIAAGLRLAVDAGQRLTQAGQQQAHRLILETKLRDLLGSALPHHFSAAPDRVHWLAVADGPQGDRRPYRYQLLLTGDEAALESCPVLAPPACAGETIRETLPLSLTSVLLRQGEQWVTGWADDTHLPNAIRLQRRGLADLVMALPVINPVNRR